MMTDLNTPTPPVGGDASGGWQSFYDSRVQMRDAATDEGLKAHFDAELEVARQTMAAMGINVPGAGEDAGGGGAVDPVQDTRITQPGGEEEFPGYSDDGSADAPPVSEIPNKDGATGDGTIPAELQQFSNEIRNASKITGVPVEYICAQIWDESKGNPRAGSTNANGGGDIGLMQVNSTNTFPGVIQPAFPDRFSPGADLWDPATNILAGASYMELQYRDFGDWGQSLRAYNSGPLNVNPNDLSDISKTGTGTATYVDKINYYVDLANSGKPLTDGYPGGNGNW